MCSKLASKGERWCYVGRGDRAALWDTVGMHAVLQLSFSRCWAETVSSLASGCSDRPTRQKGSLHMQTVQVKSLR